MKMEQMASPEEEKKAAEMMALFMPLANPPSYLFAAKFADFSLPPTFPLLWPKIYNFPVAEDDIIIASPPKSGTTWTQHITYLVQTQNFEASSKVQLTDRIPFLELPMHIPAPADMIDVFATIPSPRMMKTHLPVSLLPRDHAKAYVIFVYRNVKDAAVSYYYHHKAVQFAPYRGFDGSFHEYAKLYMKGQIYYQPYGKIVSEYFNAKTTASIPKLLLLRYEDMVKDLRSAIKSIAEFLGKDLSEETLDKIYEESLFDKLKTNDAANYSLAKTLGLWKGETDFFRKGKVGDWRDHFEEASFREEFDRHIKETIPPELYHVLD